MTDEDRPGPVFVQPALAAAISEALNEKGFGSRSGLARAVGVTPTAVTRWVSGHGVPDPSSWTAIEDFLSWKRGRIEELVGAPLVRTRSPKLLAREDVAEEVADLRRRVEQLERRVAVSEQARRNPEGHIELLAADELTGEGREPTAPGTYARPQPREQPEEFE